MKILHDGSVVCGRIWFASDDKTQPSSIKYLEEVNEFLLRSILSTKSDGSEELNTIIGKSKFDYPKPTDLISILLASGNSSNSIILDFFAGSGTTLHATMQLNAEDGGSRQCILITNNENNIAEEVCYERNRRVIEGYTNSKGQWVEGLPNNNLRYYKTEFVGRETSLENKRKLTILATELLCIKEDCYTECTTAFSSHENEVLRLFGNDAGRYLCIVYKDDMIGEAVEALKNLAATGNPTEKTKVFVFSNGQYPYTEDFEEVLEHVSLCALPDAIYKAYRNVLPEKGEPRNTNDEQFTDNEPELF